MHLAAIVPHNTRYRYFAQNTLWHSISYMLFELFLYVIPHIILKYSPKDEGFLPPHVSKIKTYLLNVICLFCVSILFLSELFKFYVRFFICSIPTSVAYFVVFIKWRFYDVAVSIIFFVIIYSYFV